MTKTIEDVLAAIEGAATAGEALDAMPDDWRFFLTGPEAGEFACSIHPAGTEGVASRTYDRGFAMGHGDTRLEAMRATVAWLRSRNAARAA